jgi:hypothetical protein
MMRNQRGDALPGIIIAVFLALILSPILYNFAIGAREVPETKIPAEAGKNCVEEKGWMRENHMQLLMDWRDTVVREGNRLYRSTAHPDMEINMSLTSECLSCHSNKEEFCDQCHNYLKVKPYCWDCHIVPPQLPKEGA